MSGDHPDKLVLTKVKARFPWLGQIHERGAILQMRAGDAALFKEFLSVEDITLKQTIDSNRAYRT